jgi:hypothetical protein
MNPDAARELMAVAGVPSAGDLRSEGETIIGLLWYNVFGSEDAQQRLGGQPYDNSDRAYAGSSNDAGLNAGVARFSADPAALAALERFETSGALAVPAVMLHTTADPIVPFGQFSRYAEKVGSAGAGDRLTVMPIERYGHCAFEAPEVLGAFDALWGKVTPTGALVASDQGLR